jgi:hypothetical protein
MFLYIYDRKRVTPTLTLIYWKISYNWPHHLGPDNQRHVSSASYLAKVWTDWYWDYIIQDSAQSKVDYINRAINVLTVKNLTADTCTHCHRKSFSAPLSISFGISTDSSYVTLSQTPQGANTTSSTLLPPVRLVERLTIQQPAHVRLGDSVTVPANLRHQHLEEVDRTLLQSRRASQPAKLITEDEAVRANLPALLLHLEGHELLRKAEESADVQTIRVGTDVQLTGEKAQLD